MAAQKKDKQINLVPKDKFEDSLLGRTLKWLLSTFRIIVVLVEMVVMLAFLSRFWLDAKNNDLDDELKSNMAQISAQASFESEFRNIQKRLDVFWALAQASGAGSEIIDSISSQIPPDVFLDDISYAQGMLVINGTSISEQSIAQFIVNLQSIEKFESVNLDKVAIDQESQGAIDFSLTIKVSQ